MKPYASLSIDLDNFWAYLKVYGDAKWEKYPSYFGKLIPKIIKFFKQHEIQTTFFIVGQDAAMETHLPHFAKIAVEGHEFGNHSYHHEPWMEKKTLGEILKELGAADSAIRSATGKKPVGFRGPGFCCNPTILEAVYTMGYSFDASLFPTITTPLARLYYLSKTKPLSSENLAQRKNLFGPIKNGFMPLKPFKWDLSVGKLLEIPVTTMPLLRFPFHLSYIMWLSKFSKRAALCYFDLALKLCKLKGIHPSLLLHPLDFLGKEEVPDLSFFPGMDLTGRHKMEIADQTLKIFKESFKILPMSEHAAIEASKK